MQSATPVAMIDLPTIDEYGVVSVSLQYLRLHAAASSSRLLPEEVRHPCALRHYFYIPRPRSHIKLYIEYDCNYMKGARMSYLLWIDTDFRLTSPADPG